MKIVSCDNCGVLLDAGKLRWPESIYNEHYEYDDTKCAWNGDCFVAFAPCPVCKAKILRGEYE